MDIQIKIIMSVSIDDSFFVFFSTFCRSFFLIYFFFVSCFIPPSDRLLVFSSGLLDLIL